MSDGHEIYVERDGTISEVYTEGSEPSDIVKVDHLVTGGTVGRMVVDGDVAVLLEFTLLGEEETAVIAMDPDTARVIAEGMLLTLSRGAATDMQGC